METSGRLRWPGIVRACGNNEGCAMIISGGEPTGCTSIIRKARQHPCSCAIALAMLVTVGSPSSAAAQSADASAPGGAPGATVDELLEMGRRLNPGLAAAALEAQAAAARIGAAGRFPDPMFRTEFWDMRAAGSTGLPEVLSQVKYSVEQTVPLWGKRDLERKIAKAEAGSAAEQRRGVETELLARIKTVFASYYATNEAVGINQELLETVGAIARVAESRYGQGRGNQQDVVTAEVERGRLQAELAQARGRTAELDRANECVAQPPGRCTARLPSGAPAGAGRGCDAARRVAGARSPRQSATGRGTGDDHRRGTERGAGAQELVSGPDLRLHRVRRGRQQRAAVRRLRGDDLVGDPAAVGVAPRPGAGSAGQSRRIAHPPRGDGRGPAGPTRASLLGARRGAPGRAESCATSTSPSRTSCCNPRSPAINSAAPTCRACCSPSRRCCG